MQQQKTYQKPKFCGEVASVANARVMRCERISKSVTILCCCTLRECSNRKSSKSLDYVVSCNCSKCAKVAIVASVGVIRRIRKSVTSMLD